jgi:PilZ domain
MRTWLIVGCSPMTSIRTRENRRNPRTEVSKGIWVSWQTTGASTVSRVRDLSVGGVFVSTPAPPPVGATVKLLFVLPEGEVRIEGIVRYAESKKGMGVEFTRMGTGDGARLRELMRRLSAPAQ